MPGEMNRTDGYGPMTGRDLGYCGGPGAPGYARGASGWVVALGEGRLEVHSQAGAVFRGSSVGCDCRQMGSVADQREEDLEYLKDKPTCSKMNSMPYVDASVRSRQKVLPILGRKSESRRIGCRADASIHRLIPVWSVHVFRGVDTDTMSAEAIENASVAAAQAQGLRPLR